MDIRMDSVEGWAAKENFEARMTFLGLIRAERLNLPQKVRNYFTKVHSV